MWQTTECILFSPAAIFIHTLPEKCKKHMEVLVKYLAVNEQLCDRVEWKQLFEVLYGRRAGIPLVSQFKFVFTLFFFCFPGLNLLRGSFVVNLNQGISFKCTLLALHQYASKVCQSLNDLKNTSL